MKTLFFSSIGAALFAVGIGITTGLAVPAAIADEPKPMALRTVMQQLGRDMQAVTGAISKEDWLLVAELAPRIGRHAEPPLAEKKRILAWLGTDAGKFRGFDQQVHEAADAMGTAARQGDGQAVIQAFAKVQQGCLDCHQSYRKQFTEHFYDKR